jgi:hypothetical protein
VSCVLYFISTFLLCLNIRSYYDKTECCFVVDRESDDSSVIKAGGLAL